MSHLQTYILKLTTLSPVFIGDGKKLSKREYLLIDDRGPKRVVIPDLPKLFRLIASHGKTDAYFRFLRASAPNNQGYRERGQDRNHDALYPFLKASLAGMDLEKELGLYTVAGEGVGRAVEIQTFVKDAYGKPYIPGSSIKGALRTAMLSELLCNPKVPGYEGKKGNVAKYKEEVQAGMNENKGRNAYLKKPMESLESLGFGDIDVGRQLETLARGAVTKQARTGGIDAGRQPEEKSVMGRFGYRKEDVQEAGREGNPPLRSIMRGLRIGDSHPLDTKDLMLCQKIDITKAGKPAGTGTGINLMRECLKPGVQVEFPVTIDTTMFVDGEQRPLDAQILIMDSVNHFLAKYRKVFLDKFTTENNHLSIPGKDVLYLGGGAGYHTKSIAYPLFGETGGLHLVSTIMQKQFRDHHHENDLRLGISPHVMKCTKVGSRELEFGACRISMERVG
jgi:CRISPR-associated protein Csm5